MRKALAIKRSSLPSKDTGSLPGYENCRLWMASQNDSYHQQNGRGPEHKNHAARIPSSACPPQILRHGGFAEFNQRRYRHGSSTPEHPSPGSSSVSSSVFSLTNCAVANRRWRSKSLPARCRQPRASAECCSKSQGCQAAMQEICR